MLTFWKAFQQHNFWPQTTSEAGPPLGALVRTNVSHGIARRTDFDNSTTLSAEMVIFDLPCLALKGGPILFDNPMIAWYERQDIWYLRLVRQMQRERWKEDAWTNSVTSQFGEHFAIMWPWNVYTHRTDDYPKIGWIHKIGLNLTFVQTFSTFPRFLRVQKSFFRQLSYFWFFFWVNILPKFCPDSGSSLSCDKHQSYTHSLRAICPGPR